jgi:uncharacterized membrane protein
MSTVSKSIRVGIPASKAFREWTRFEELPRFLPGVREVRQLDERHLHWRAEIAGLERLWQLELREVVPGQRIAWRTVSGPANRGEVSFESLAPSETQVTMTVSYDPEGFVEIVTDYLGMLGFWVDRCLGRFRNFMERPDSTLSRLPAPEDLIGQ